MPTLPTDYQRKGRMTSLQLDFDAWQLLQELAPTSKGYGRFLSELLRREAALREERQKIRAAMQTALAETAS